MLGMLARAALRRSAVAAILALCVTGAHAADKIRAGTPEPTAFVFSPVTVGIETGIFKKNGLDVERIDFAGGAKMHQAMTAGSLDVIVGTGSDMLFLIRGAPERGVAAYANDLNSLSLVVRNDGSIKSIADLKGKTIATTTPGSFTSWIAKTIASKHGFGPDGVKLAYLGQMAGIISGLLSKNVDAMVGTTSASLQLEKEGKARILVKAGDEIHDFIADILYASEPMMTQHPATLRRFLAAWFETTRYMKAHKAETIRITQKMTHLPDDIATKTYDAEMPTFFDNGHFDRKKLAAVQQALIDVGVIEKPAPADQLITEKFLP
ncbi:MAG TPA: ABC transporter substrate-binding protein [Stellaceae bacterium]|nr:ABC transporter substrate-binding protein [Stellaceae bacterium]